MYMPYKTPNFLYVGHFRDVRWTSEQYFNDKSDGSFKHESVKEKRLTCLTPWVVWALWSPMLAPEIGATIPKPIADDVCGNETDEDWGTATADWNSKFNLALTKIIFCN